jgi:hypothetical protein
MIIKVISGGQTGADQAGLAAAKKYNIPTGGFAPKGYQTSEGKNRTLLQKVYDLTESVGGYKKRTWQNAELADGTIRLAVDFTSRGEICTLNGINKYKKPHIDIQLKDVNEFETIMVDDCLSWLIENKIKILNVAGNTQNTLGFDIYKMSYDFLCLVFEKHLIKFYGDFRKMAGL